jgi:tRNA(Ile)-lysidine synthase
MSFDSRFLHRRLTEFRSLGGPPSRYLVAYSGGADSTVLLHALASAETANPVPVVALHVDHGLHQDSAAWEVRCRLQAERLGIEYRSERVRVTHDAGSGPEAAARDARYAWLGSQMQDGDWLLSAHHEDDQAETLLLNLMRGSGIMGLAGIGAMRRFSSGWLVRPLLGISGDTLRAYAELHRLPWTDDPSNADTNFDRNYLRQKVLPLLAARWPAAAARLRRSADLAAEASDMLDELAAIDTAAPSPCNRLDIASLLRLSGARQRNVIRYALRRSGLSPPPASRLHQVLHELIPARADAQPLVSWPGGEIRRYREYLYLLAPLATMPAAPPGRLRPGSVLDLGSGQGRLELQRDANGGIAPALAEQGLSVLYRQGGEEILLPKQTHRRKLKKLLQDEAIVPWMRDRLPLLFAVRRLVAVADLWIDTECVSTKGYSVHWLDKPTLY